MAIELSEKAFFEGEVPVGAIIVQGDTILAKCYNKKERSKISTYHAEILAIEEASRKKGDWRLDDCIMYVSLEPCMMCLGAIKEARIKKVIYVVKDQQKKKQKETVKIEQIDNELLINSSVDMLKKFFKNRRR